MFKFVFSLASLTRNPISLALVLMLSADAVADDYQPLRERIEWLMEQGGMPSLSISVAREGEIVFEEAWGYADVEKQIPASPDTPYSMASISKPITAVALMRLVDKGRVDLDRPINDYLGEAKVTVHVGDPDEVTVRRVLNHTAGLPLHYHFFYEGSGANRPSMDESIHKYGHTVTAPGERFVYSNFGFGLLEYVIERVSGMTYSAFLDKEVFGPLGMTHSTVNRDKTFDLPAAVRYEKDGSVVPFYDFDHRGASAVYSSTNDLVRFGSFLIGRSFPGQEEILTPETRNQMTAVADFPDSHGESVYGLGINVRNEEGWTIFSHSGGMPGVATTLTTYPEQGIVVAVAVNTLKETTHSAVNEIRKTAFEIARAGIPKTPPKLSDELVGEWQGAIHTDEGDIPLSVKIADDGGISVSLAGGEYQAADLWDRDDEIHIIVARSIEIPVSDAKYYPHHLVLSVQRRGETLTGSATAYPSPDIIPMGSALSFWVELEKRS